ncbi:helix-turn-helix transcriptional regulator [Kineococcus sp. SYSU DK018]|uniref:helix-turn-helix transcriptional regulator n=1 Tax=Kineococcus sp. SYSU DK018 TaxID=3383139 RepID=UPI003D7CE1F8
MKGKTKESSSAKQLHNRLAVLRTERGITRRELAEAVGINVQTVGFLERGDYGPSVELALRLAGYFALPVEAIFSLTPFPPMSAQLYPTSATSVALPPASSLTAGANS